MAGSKLTTVDGNTTSGHLEEMIPPSSSWGKTFVTVPFAGRVRGDVFRIIASLDETVISLTPTSTQITARATINAGYFHELDASSDEYYFISTNKPVLVVQYSKSADLHDNTTEPFMSIVVPLKQYKKGYSFATPSSKTSSGKKYVSIVCKTHECDHLYLDGRPISTANLATNWTSIPGSSTGLSVVTLEIHSGPHTLLHPSLTARFGVQAYGETYGYPVGSGIAPLLVTTTTHEQTTTAAMTSTTALATTTAVQEATTTVFFDTVLVAIANEISKQIGINNMGGGPDDNDNNGGDVPPEVIAGSTVPTIILIVGILGTCAFFLAFKKRKRRRDEEEEDSDAEEDPKKDKSGNWIPKEREKPKKRSLMDYFRSSSPVVPWSSGGSKADDDDDFFFMPRSNTSSPDTMMSDFSSSESPTPSAVSTPTGPVTGLPINRSNTSSTGRAMQQPSRRSSPRPTMPSKVSMNPKGSLAENLSSNKEKATRRTSSRSRSSSGNQSPDGFFTPRMDRSVTPLSVSDLFDDNISIMSNSSVDLNETIKSKSFSASQGSQAGGGNSFWGARGRPSNSTDSPHPLTPVGTPGDGNAPQATRSRRPLQRSSSSTSSQQAEDHTPSRTPRKNPKAQVTNAPPTDAVPAWSDTRKLDDFYKSRKTSLSLMSNRTDKAKAINLTRKHKPQQSTIDDSDEIPEIAISMNPRGSSPASNKNEDRPPTPRSGWLV